MICLHQILIHTLQEMRLSRNHPEPEISTINAVSTSDMKLWNKLPFNI